jgi:hypothetical protein
MKFLACASVGVLVGLFGCSSGSGNNAGSGGHGGGGSGGTGGRGGSGGNVDASTDATTGSLNITFMNDTEGFAIDPFANQPPFGPGNPQNIGGVPNGAAAPMAVFDGAEGMPTPGSLQITATFTDFNQTVSVPKIYTPTINLRGKRITAQVRLDTGSFTGLVHLFALSSPSVGDAAGYFFAQGNSVRPTDNNWRMLTFNMSSPEFAANGFDAGDIVQFGIQLASGEGPTGAGGAGGGGGGAGGSTGADGGGTDGASDAPAGAGGTGGSTSSYGAPQSVSFHIDTITSN